jgi:uncharacterized protein YqcC (DUF446 family)
VGVNSAHARVLDGGHPLPQAFAVSPYYEMALERRTLRATSC